MKRLLFFRNKDKYRARGDYANNNPLYYTDPSGHVNQSQCNYLKNYNCEAPEWAKKWEKIRLTIQYALDQPDNPEAIEAASGALDDLAELLGIHLPEGNHWVYVDSIFGAGGWNPVNPSDQSFFYLYTDENGKKVYGLKTGEDSAVYITGDLFKDCGWNLFCIGGAMFHEAGHAWLELLSRDRDAYPPAPVEKNEEILLSNMAIERFGDPAGLQAFNIQTTKESEECTTYVGTCDNPLNVVGSWYGHATPESQQAFQNYLWGLITGTISY